MGRTIKEALDRAEEKDNRAYRYSYDMLGEGALTTPDGERYHRAYVDAIKALGARGPFPNVLDAPSISIKLSALHPRYEVAKRERVFAELQPNCSNSRSSPKRRASLTVDAEESERLEISLDIIAAVHADPSLAGWQGFGLAVQAYQKRAPFVIDWLAEKAKANGQRWCVRLVKGAYWDSEVKRAQEGGRRDIRYSHASRIRTSSYLACARRLFDYGELFYPAFATHNAHTIAAIHHMARGRPFEFQRLHGMGADLYAEVVGERNLNAPCRVYAPVGSHEDLLPYLVRRLLENGANTSFVNRIVDENLSIRDLVADPVEVVRHFTTKPHPRIPQPAGLFGEQRKNSMGVNLGNDNELKALADAIAASPQTWAAKPLVPGANATAAAVPVTDPADRRRTVGTLAAGRRGRRRQGGRQRSRRADRLGPHAGRGRAKILEHTADLMEANRGELIALCVREAGKTIPDAIAEVREAVDFCRYYAAQARKMLAHGEALPGPTGESNQLFLNGRGVFVAISPWNFPLAIFIGQVVAALVSRQRGHRQARRTDQPRWRSARRSCCTKPACRPAYCSSCRATARRSARHSARIRVSPASCSRARPKPRERSIARSPHATPQSPC